MRLAVLTDSHLPAAAGSVQQACLEWAVDTIRREQPDGVLVLGDMTGAGEPDAVRAVRRVLAPLAFPVWSTPGNAELRFPELADASRAALTFAPDAALDGLHVLTLDTASRTVPAPAREQTEAALARTDGQPVLIASHCPPVSLYPGDQAWLLDVLERHPRALMVCGHRHFSGSDDSAGRAWLFRGIDPEKALGAPAIGWLTLSPDGWQRADTPWPAAVPSTWPDEERHAFASMLGLACINDPLAELAWAAEHRLGVLELRAVKVTPANVPRAELLAAVGRWRDRGGRHLSVHLTDLGWDAAGGAVTGVEAWQEALDLARQVNAQALTAHPPRATVAGMEPGGSAWDALLAETARGLAPLLAEGCQVAIENLHLNHGEPDDDRRRFGYVPSEVLAWMQAVRQATGSETVGCLMDIGHARNNGWFSRLHTIGAWFAAAGPHIRGYHLHQMRPVDGLPRNHLPFDDGVYGRDISLAALFAAWRLGLVARAPMYLEIRGREAAAASWHCLRAAVLGQ